MKKHLAFFFIFILSFLGAIGVFLYPSKPSTSHRDVLAVTTRPYLPPLDKFPRGHKAHIPVRLVNNPQPSFKAAVQAASALSPDVIKQAYNLPSSGGRGTIAVVVAYRSPKLESDLASFSQQFGLPSCTQQNGCLTIHYQSSTPPSLSPSGANWDLETTLDVEWAHAIAPTAKILVATANSLDAADLVTAIDYARNQPDVVSISMSWGSDEFTEQTQYDNYFTSPTGAAFFTASGDNGTGSSWPAASPRIITVGGTTLKFNSSGSVTNETAWSGSGGGVSQYFALPAYQKNFGITTNGRAIPDVSLNADATNSPFAIYFNGQWRAVGGTSASSPCLAAMNSLSPQNFSHDTLYTNARTAYATYYRDITSGTNGSCGSNCTAKQGYDLVTGLGSPIRLPAIPTTPSANPSPTTGITNNPTSEPTGIPQAGVGLSLPVYLHGIGQGGDNANPTSGGNPNPLRTTRSIQGTFITGTNQILPPVNANFLYDSTMGGFKGILPTTSIPAGDYVLKIYSPGFLTRQVAGVVRIVANQSITAPAIKLSTGDITLDNKSDSLDYQAISDCFGAKLSTCTYKNTADLNDDGKVDGVDYNLFIRELSVQVGD